MADTTTQTNVQAPNTTPTNQSDKLNQILAAALILTNARNSIQALSELNEITQDINSVLSKLDLLKSQEECNLEEDNEEEEPTPDPDPEEEPTVPVTPPTTPTTPTLKYAPYVKPVSGNLNLCCIGLKWKDNPGPAMNAVSNACTKTAQTYKELSNGALNFIPTTKSIEVPQSHLPGQLSAAEKVAKNKANATRKPGTKPYDIFAIVHNKVRNFSNAGGNTAHLYGTLTRDFLHEIGHLKPLSLGHAGVYDAKTKKILAYNDGGSFMGKFSSDKLTAPQMYYLGWLPEKKVALHDVDAPDTEYKLETLFTKKQSDNLKAVMVKRTGAPLIVSYVPHYDKKTNKTTNLFGVHVPYGGVSHRYALFKQEGSFKDEFNFKAISSDANTATVKISRGKSA